MQHPHLEEKYLDLMQQKFELNKQFDNNKVELKINYMHKFILSTVCSKQKTSNGDCSVRFNFHSSTFLEDEIQKIFNHFNYYKPHMLKPTWIKCNDGSISIDIEFKSPLNC